MAIRVKSIFVAALLFASACGAAEVDTVITNGKIWTGNPAQAWAKAVAIKDARIVAVGDEISSDFVAAKTIDAKGRLVLPGFIDNHTHFMHGSASLVSVKTQSAKTKEAFVDTIRTYAQKLHKGEWIVGGIWDHEAWGGELPTRAWIDDFTADNPLFLQRTDGHMGLANSAALRLAGIDKNTADPLGGLIVRDEEGVATGMLKDRAMEMMWKIIPPPSAQQAEKMFDTGIAEALKNGVTQIHNVSDWQNINHFQKAKSEGRLKIRTYYLPHISHRHQLANFIEQHGKGDDWLRFGGVKELVDGSLGSSTAWFYQPYSDQPETNGFPLMTMEELKISLVEAHALGLQLAIHGIGDQAIDQLLDLFEEIGAKGHRARVEHAQHLSTIAIKRFAELGVVPSMQPYHAIDDGRWAEKRIGAERLKGTYAFNSLLKADARLTFGSDWSVAPLDPLKGIYAAVTRRTLDGKNPDGWVPEEKITVEQAVRAYTINNAWAGNQEDDLGTIEPGKLADLVILNENIFAIPAEQIADSSVYMTMINGEVMYRAE